MNEEIIPRLVTMGYLKPGNVFKYAKRLEMSDKDQIELYRFLTDKFEISADEIEKTFGVNVGRQLNLESGNAGNSEGVRGGDGGQYVMTDEEYYKRYGHHRGGAVNFLRERK